MESLCWKRPTCFRMHKNHNSHRPTSLQPTTVRPAMSRAAPGFTHWTISFVTQQDYCTHGRLHDSSEHWLQIPKPKNSRWNCREVMAPFRALCYNQSVCILALQYSNQPEIEKIHRANQHKSAFLIPKLFTYRMEISDPGSLFWGVANLLAAFSLAVLISLDRNSMVGETWFRISL